MGKDSEDEEEARYGTASFSGRKQAEETDDEWCGEIYEKDTVIRTGKNQETDETVFLEYMKELSRVPDQCLRLYSLDGATASDPSIPYAWPSKDPDIMTPCPNCGGPRCCIAQVMSPLIAAMLESVQMVEDGSKYSNPPTSWDWATLAVSICSKQCTTRRIRNDEMMLVEEEIVPVGIA